MRLSQRCLGAIAVPIMVAVAGCAGAKVTQQSQSYPVEWTRPSQIVVYPLAADPSDVTHNQSIIQTTYKSVSGDNENAAQLQIARDTAELVCQQVVSDLNANGYNALCATRGTVVAGDNVLIIDGQFANISEGNRLRRLVIGLLNSV